MKYLRLKMNKILKILVFSSVFAMLAFQAVQYQRSLYWGFYRQAMWADKAGYYSYLPFFIIYGGHAQALPDSTVEKTGFGFSIENEKLISKYPIGVAMLQAPFFGMAWVAHQIKPWNGPFYGFEGRFTDFMVLSATFYTSLGLWLLFESLKIMTGRAGLAAVVTAVILLCSSLYYYTIIEGMMSHAYSFFLFSGLIYVWLRVLISAQPNKLCLAILAFFISMIVLVRPFNLLMIPFFMWAVVWLHQVPLHIAWGKLKMLIFWLLPLGLILAFPQLLYFKYAFGTWLTDAYRGETFRFTSPQIIPMYTSISYGLFVYVPLFALLFASTFVMTLRDKARFWPLAAFIIIFSYILSSWHSWSFGCGFGIRPFVEWLPLLAISFAFWLKEIKSTRRRALLFLMLLITFYNIKMTFAWTGCWFGVEETLAEYIRWFWK